MSPYGPEVVEYCQRLYLRFNGGQHERIEQEMRKLYPSWRKQNLYSRGKDTGGKQRKIGWIEFYGFNDALRIHLEQKPGALLNSAQQLVREIDVVRKRLYGDIVARGTAAVEKEQLQLHRDYSRLSIEALTKVEAARDTLSGFATFWERLLDGAMQIDVKFARELIKFSDAVIQWAEKEFNELEGFAESADANNSMNVDQNPSHPAPDGRTESRANARRDAAGTAEAGAAVGS